MVIEWPIIHSHSKLQISPEGFTFSNDYSIPMVSDGKSHYTMHDFVACKQELGQKSSINYLNEFWDRLLFINLMAKRG